MASPCLAHYVVSGKARPAMSRGRVHGVYEMLRHVQANVQAKCLVISATKGLSSIFSSGQGREEHPEASRLETSPGSLPQAIPAPKS